MAEQPQIFSRISDADRRECERLYNQGGIEALREYYREKADEWKKIPLNVGIIGNSGSGKSSLINAIRGLTADDEGAAEVGVTETTNQPTPYAHPNNEQLKFWDLPGVGTQTFPKESYLERISFAEFDFFLIITHSRFTENDKWLANEISKEGKQFFFVRTKIHFDVKNDKHAHPKTHNREAVLKKIRENIQENLEDSFNERKVFLIDNHKRGMYDFNRLEQRIIEEFPSLKRKALILSLGTLSVEMVKKKAETLREGIWITSLVSGAFAIIPFPGTSIAVDSALIFAVTQDFFSQLGLDERSLEHKARILSCDVAVLQRVVKEPMREFLTWEGIMAFIRAIPIVALALAAEEGAHFIPFIGSLIASGLSFGTTYYILDEILKKMEDTAVQVVKVAIDNSVDQLLPNDFNN